MWFDAARLITSNKTLGRNFRGFENKIINLHYSSVVEVCTPPPPKKKKPNSLGCQRKGDIWEVPMVWCVSFGSVRFAEIIGVRGKRCNNLRYKRNLFNLELCYTSRKKREKIWEHEVIQRPCQSGYTNSGRLNFVQRLVAFVRPLYGTCFKSYFSFLQFWKLC